MRKLNKGAKVVIFAPMAIMAIIIVGIVVINVLAKVDFASPAGAATVIVICVAVGFTAGAILATLCGGSAVTPDKAHAAEVAKLEQKIQDLESGSKLEEIAKDTADRVIDKVEKIITPTSTSDADKIAALSALTKKKGRKDVIEKAFKKAKKDA